MKKKVEAAENQVCFRLVFDVRITRCDFAVSSMIFAFVFLSRFLHAQERKNSFIEWKRRQKTLIVCVLLLVRCSNKLVDKEDIRWDSQV